MKISHAGNWDSRSRSCLRGEGTGFEKSKVSQRSSQKYLTGLLGRWRAWKLEAQETSMFVFPNGVPPISPKQFIASKSGHYQITINFLEDPINTLGHGKIVPPQIQETFTWENIHVNLFRLDVGMWVDFISFACFFTSAIGMIELRFRQSLPGWCPFPGGFVQHVVLLGQKEGTPSWDADAWGYYEIALRTRTGNFCHKRIHYIIHSRCLFSWSNWH